jgi:hypothetical protein
MSVDAVDRASGELSTYDYNWSTLYIRLIYEIYDGVSRTFLEGCLA